MAPKTATPDSPAAGVAGHPARHFGQVGLVVATEAPQQPSLLPAHNCRQARANDRQSRPYGRAGVDQRPARPANTGPGAGGSRAQAQTLAATPAAPAGSGLPAPTPSARHPPPPSSARRR